jgi:hypothetical protein
VIRLAYEGARRSLVNDDGDLIVETSRGALRVAKPFIYQEHAGRRVPVEGGFALAGNESNVVGVRVARYDRGQPLIIDPLVYLITPGGLGDDSGESIAVDASGNAYVAGSSQPVGGGGNTLAFVWKFDVHGTLVYETYVGGNGPDQAQGIAIDGARNAYVTGFTGSTNFPASCTAIGPCTPLSGTLAGGFDAFVAKLDPSGVLVYATYLGGVADDAGTGITVDTAGNAHVVGTTGSSDFPRTVAGLLGGASDAFVSKLNSLGSSLLYSRLLGGSGIDEGLGIALDPDGNAYLTGATASPNFPTIPNICPSIFVPCHPLQGTLRGSRDAFVSMLDSTGDLIYSTYLGGTGDDAGHAIALDPNRNAYVTGVTRSADFPTVGTRPAWPAAPTPSSSG